MGEDSDTMIERNSYIDRIRPYIGKPYIKVLTGIRRCGKSSILLLLKEELKAGGVDEEHIIHINFENLSYMDLLTAPKLREYLLEQMTGSGVYYILLDEIQEVTGWERAVNSLMVESNANLENTTEQKRKFVADIYITGSNSKLLSSELATYIAGRYISIEIMPLSFAEYITFRESLAKLPRITDVFHDYLRRGGFPRVALDNNEYEQDYKTIYDIYTSILLLDTVKRHNIRDLELLNRVIRFVLDNVGNTFSAKKIADYFKSQQRSVHIETIYNYLDALEEAYIITRIPRYDIRGKELLKTNEKYFVGDHSLIYALLGYHDHSISGVLENIVMQELKRRSYTVYAGKLGNREIDFIAQRRSEKVYIQVTYKLDSDTVIQREFTPLLDIRDAYPKYVLSLDEFWQDTVEGVKYKSLPEFLLMKEF
jgi:predicted AAA+ superfamily ATPase